MDLQSFGLSEKTGFCLEEPLTELGPKFSEWHRLADSMPDMIRCGNVRQEVDKMTQLDSSLLSSYREQILAHLQLSIIASGYVWGCGDDQVAKSIPACVAVPLYTLSKKLDLLPCTCHANRTLANWTLIDPTGPITNENTRPLYPLLCTGDDGMLFTQITHMTELAFGPSVKAIASVLAAMDAEDMDVIPGHLDVITQCLYDMEKTFSRMNEVQLYSFLYDLAPFFRSWGGKEDSPIPDGLIFEGVSDTPVKGVNDTAAQTPSISAVDALLGITHSKLKMRSTMAPGHRRFITTIEERPKGLRDLVENTNNKELAEAFNRCLNAVTAFRSKHFQIVARFMIVAPKKKAQEAEAKGETQEIPDFSGVTNFLKDCRQATVKSELPTSATQQSQ